MKSKRANSNTYEALVGVARFLCYYCGELADSRDHFPPLAAQHTPASVGVKHVLVPCCRECNNLLGASSQNTLAGRAQYLKERLRRRYAAELRFKEWAPDELAELGPSLRAEIEAAMRLRARAVLRIAYQPESQEGASQELPA